MSRSPDGHFLKTVFHQVLPVDNSRRDVCNRGCDPRIGLDGASLHAHDPQLIASLRLFCGQYGDVTKMAKDREQSRQSLYREAEQVVNAVDGAAAQARSDEQQQQIVAQRTEIQALQERLQHAVEITPEKRHEFATVAQAEEVSLSVARRLFQVVEGAEPTPSVATLGRATLEAGQHAGGLLEVLDEAARPLVQQGTVDEIFLAENRF